MEYLNINTGNKPYLLLINGLLSPKSNLDSFIDYYKKRYNILLPLLPGTDGKPSQFTNFLDLVKDIEAYCLANKLEITYVYGLSMGGVLASLLLTREIIKPKVLIMESSPILGFGSIMEKALIYNYGRLCDLLRIADKKTISKACKTIISDASLLPDLAAVLDNTSNSEIEKYLKEVAKYKMSVKKLDTKLCYLYGSTLSESYMRKSGKFIKKNYQNSIVLKIKGKHLEMALFDELSHNKIIDNLLN